MTRHFNTVRDSSHKFEIVTLSGSVTINVVEKNLACPGGNRTFQMFEGS
jgi:hypothetical protein